MSLQIGQQLSSYEITSLIGKGGMGEVYRARDTKLKRDIAIKILPDEFSRDPDRVSRFQREAESLAALNHQNIAAIYDLQQSDGTRFLILEFVEGETLADILKQRGALPVDEALHIAKQICEALEAAHEKGIIHRDLKPANVKITPEGKVKVLDFGLAKAFEAQGSQANLSQSPTLSMAATNAGLILGTAAYMSPEQAKGKSVDKRADIWAFGVVLYEMLTGRMMFSGETASETMAAVMMKEPDWSALPANTPSRLRDLLRRCLIKEPRNRVRDAGDARIAIEEAIANPDMEAPAAEAARAALPASRPRWRRVLRALAMLAIIAAAVYTAYVPRTVQRGVMRFSVDHPDEANFSDAYTGLISPDGQRIAFVARDKAGKALIWIRSLSSFTAQPLTGTEGAIFPFWSPDSRFLGFFAGGKLKKIEVSGGPPQTLCAAVAGRGGAWNADGVIIFAADTTSPLLRVSAEGGEPKPVTVLDSKNSESGHRWPSFLPDGRHFIYTINATGEAGGIYAGSLDSNDKKRLVTATANAVFASAGYLLFLREGTLVARAFDPKRLEFTGEAVPVAEHIVATNNLGSFSVSSNGTLLFRTGAAAATQLTWFDRDGKTLGTAGPPGNYAHAVLSPDEKKVAVTRDGDIWVIDLARGTNTRFTFDAALDNCSIWSPDGTSIVFSSSREGASGNLYQKVSSGAGKDELILKTPFAKCPFGWSLDGRFVTYHETSLKGGNDLYMLPMTGDRKPIPYLQTEFSEFENVLSSDNQWMAYSSTESGRSEVYVQPFPTSGGKWQVSTTGGVQAQWRRDGKELFYVALDGTLMAADVKTGSKFEPGVPHPLFKMNTQVNGARNSYSPTADGRRFLVNSFVDTAGSSAISVVVNWAADLKK